MIRKLNLIEIIDLLEGYKKDDYLVMRHNQIFKPENFYVFFESMLDIADKIEDFNIIVDLTRRRGLIVVLQEE